MKQLKFALLMIFIVLIVSSNCVLAQDKTFPTEIDNLTMGAPQSEVIGKISQVGSHSVDAAKRRPKLTWVMPSSSPYQDIEFTFTEKDRLFLVRFNVRTESRNSFLDLKKKFFDRYEFSWEEPMKLRVSNGDALLYSGKQSDLFFFEFTDRTNSNKSMELFNRSISAQDRMQTAQQTNKIEPVADTNGTPDKAPSAPVEPK